MPPSAANLQARPDLADGLEEFDLVMDQRGFIGHRVLPVFQTPLQSGKFARIPIEQLLKQRETKRGVAGAYNRGDWDFTTDSFATDENGWEEVVDEREAKIYMEYLDAEQVATDVAYDVVLRNAERRIANALYNETTFSGQITTLTNEWDKDHISDATPILDIEDAVRAVWSRTGLWPNTLIINRQQFRNLRLLDDITAKLHSQGAGETIKPSMISTEKLKEIFDLENIFVSGSADNTAEEGADVSISSIWSDEYAMVCRTVRTKNIREPGLGRTFHWAGDGSEVDGRIESYEEERVRGKVIRVRHEVDEKILMIESAQLLKNVTTI